MISRAELQRLASREKVGLGVLEKDYVLTRVLNCLPLAGGLDELLIFKGGTALRKIFFPDWRYSEDLDFTVKRDMDKEELRHHLDNWYASVADNSGIKLKTDMLHKPNGYSRLRIQFNGPLAYPGKIFMDLSFDEPLCCDPARRPVITRPFEDTGGLIYVYTIEELLAEKVRSLRERGKSRDYYDVWRITREHMPLIDGKLFNDVLAKKLAHKGINLKTVQDLLPRDINTLQRYWDAELSHQVDDLKPLPVVLPELRVSLERLIDAAIFHE